jgi:hypothetical protein
VSKMVTWIGLMAGIMLVCYFGGVMPDDATTGALLSIVLNPGSLENTDWVNIVIGNGLIALGVTLGTVALARFTPGDFYVVIPFVSVLFSFGWDFLQVFLALFALGGVSSGIAVLIFGPIMVMYLVSVVEWWRTSQ